MFAHEQKAPAAKLDKSRMTLQDLKDNSLNPDGFDKGIVSTLFYTLFHGTLQRLKEMAEKGERVGQINLKDIVFKFNPFIVEIKPQFATVLKLKLSNDLNRIADLFEKVAPDIMFENRKYINAICALLKNNLVDSNLLLDSAIECLDCLTNDKFTKQLVELGHAFEESHYGKDPLSESQNRNLSEYSSKPHLMYLILNKFELPLRLSFLKSLDIDILGTVCSNQNCLYYFMTLLSKEEKLIVVNRLGPDFFTQRGIDLFKLDLLADFSMHQCVDFVLPNESKVIPKFMGVARLFNHFSNKREELFKKIGLEKLVKLLGNGNPLKELADAKIIDLKSFLHTFLCFFLENEKDKKGELNQDAFKNLFRTIKKFKDCPVVYKEMLTEALHLYTLTMQARIKGSSFTCRKQTKLTAARAMQQFGIHREDFSAWIGALTDRHKSAFKPTSNLGEAYEQVRAYEQVLASEQVRVREQVRRLK